MRMLLGLGAMLAVATMGCSELGSTSCDLPPPLLMKTDIEGPWSYTSTIMEERDGVWVDVSTSEPLLVHARVDENYVVFDTIADPQPAQVFRVVRHGTIEAELVQTCAGERARETVDARPWSEHNGFSMVWSAGLIAPPSLREREGNISPGFLTMTPMPELPLRGAAGEVLRWSMPTNYFIATCNDSESCFSEVLVRHTFTRTP